MDRTWSFGSPFIIACFFGGPAVAESPATVGAEAGPPGAAPSSRPRPLSDRELQEAPVIWGAESILPDGSGLAFGGSGQEGHGGPSRTRSREGGAWKRIDDELRRGNPLQALHEEAWALSRLAKLQGTRTRALYLEGLSPEEEERRVKGARSFELDVLLERAASLEEKVAKLAEGGRPETSRAARTALELVRAAAKEVEGAARGLPRISTDVVRALFRAQVDLERAAEALDAEPLPRALSPIAFDPKTGLFVLFGGDHLDFLMNDTWVFDPRGRRWTRREPPSSPPPRANHRLEARGDGTVVLTGGYAYTSSTDYSGSQYRDLGDGPWTYDLAAGAWSGSGKVGPPGLREYRAGPFHPDFFLEGERPDRDAFEARLRAIPANSWTVLSPPRIPRQNRDWGTAVIDPSRDLILYWSGGHCAHGGSDVLHLHLATGRWELPFPVEFPLGQLYANTAYPGGLNLNRRPWPTGHTYLAYAVDPISRMLLFIGHRRWCDIYDPDVADWTGRFEKPEGMAYPDCFYDLNSCATASGIACWTKEGRIFRFDAAAGAWSELKVAGSVPASSVDFSTVVYDGKRDRLLLFRTDYGKAYDGQVHEVDLKGLTARPLSPGNMAAAAARGPFGIDRACYHPGADLVLFGTLLPPGPGGLRRTPAYDPSGNRWISLRIAFSTAGEKVEPRTPRGHSSGIAFDPKRGLVWGVDASCEVYALSLDVPSADARPME